MGPLHTVIVLLAFIAPVIFLAYGSCHHPALSWT